MKVASFTKRKRGPDRGIERKRVVHISQCMRVFVRSLLCGMSSRVEVMTAGTHHLHLTSNHDSVLSKSGSSSSTATCNVSDIITDAQYVSSTCIVYTFYHDLNSVIEDHFNKALRPSYKHKGECKSLCERRDRAESG